MSDDDGWEEDEAFGENLTADSSRATTPNATQFITLLDPRTGAAAAGAAAAGAAGAAGAASGAAGAASGAADNSCFVIAVFPSGSVLSDILIPERRSDDSIVGTVSDSIVRYSNVLKNIL